MVPNTSVKRLWQFDQQGRTLFENIVLSASKREKSKMNLETYFKSVSGKGILATCQPGQNVDMAIYAKPHVADEKTVIFVMKERLSHQNLRSNLQAAYMFIEDGAGYKGLRLSLTMIREEKNRTLVESMRQKQPCIYPVDDDSDKFLVYFQVDRIRPLVGDGPMTL